MKSSSAFSAGLVSLILLLGSAQGVYSQFSDVTDDFEGAGTIDSWSGGDCLLDTNFPNPFTDAENPSATVMRYEDTGGTYANAYFTNDVNFNMNAGTAFTLKVYVPSNGITGGSPNQVSLKLQNGFLGAPWGTQTEIIHPIVLDQWQTLTFDFSSGEHLNFNPGSPDPVERIDFNRVLLQVNGENNSDPVVAYFDDFDYNGQIGYEPDEAESVFDVLVWSDEFDADGPVDPSKWHHQTQLPNPWGWFNAEQQHYTDEITNSYVEDGHLHIVAIREDYTDQGLTREFTSARLNSKFAFTYGRVEVRAKMPFGAGTWPAIWLLGKNISEAGGYWYPEFGTTSWPDCGEIDIMEHWGTNQNYVSSALHTPSSSGATENVDGLYGPDVSDVFHIYGMEWDEEEIRFTFDGQVHYVYHPEVQNAATWPYFEDQYFLLNVAIQDVIEPSFTQSEMEIDYIRVYQEELLNVSETTPDTTEIKAAFSSRMVGDQLVIENTASFPGTVRIYDVQGRLLLEPVALNTGTQTIPVKAFSGALVLRFDANGFSWGETLVP